jgi:hypothetical protein
MTQSEEMPSGRLFEYLILIINTLWEICCIV